MNVTEYMRKHGLTDADLDAMAEPYERGDYASGSGDVFTGSHLDAVGKRRVTVIYDARDTQRVAAIARSRGVKTSEIYRDALDYYLAAQV
ncbi:NADP oxidoreductase [Collinsella sp. An2]|uniref:NADP oxidoreductase n=1 Tax=Collinsella sp. An2 TaxID=1965585 RepID=UPI000B39E500|nr:NADP oxidoreductase [Collinsella sp. An2]OUP06135.1 NADP oxidoreductase [Collinsella sp. An2]